MPTLFCHICLIQTPLRRGAKRRDASFGCEAPGVLKAADIGILQRRHDAGLCQGPMNPSSISQLFGS